jgi:hypothetical protein
VTEEAQNGGNTNGGRVNSRIEENEGREAGGSVNFMCESLPTSRR